MKILQVVDNGFRTLTEEQDDTILWLTQSMHNAGANADTLLSGHAVYYAVLKNTQPKVKIGSWIQRQPASISDDIARMTEKKSVIYVLREDLDTFGIPINQVHQGIQIIDRQDLARIYATVDQVWQW